MSAYNNSLWYYKRYYADQGDEKIHWGEKEKNETTFQRRNKALFASLFSENLPWSYPEKGLANIPLVTTYPGLLLGSGIAHGTGMLGELKLGYFFDHTTGLPVIPGSSVKGVIRSAFPTAYRAEGHQEKARQLVVLMQYYLNQVTKLAWPEESVYELEAFIFGTFQPGKSKAPHPGRIIFHDAIPVNADRVKLNGQPIRRYLADDYITPHNKSKDPQKIPHALVNPVPIAFLKVLPGVEFRFQFNLQTFPLEREEKKWILEEEQMRQLFELILLDMGVGAKTNVGYGRWEKPDPKQVAYPSSREKESARDLALEDIKRGKDSKKTKASSQKNKKQQQANKNPVTTSSLPPTTDPELPAKYFYNGELEEGMELTGVVIRGPKGKRSRKRMRFKVNGEYVTRSHQEDIVQNFSFGDILTCKVYLSEEGKVITNYSDPKKIGSVNA